MAAKITQAFYLQTTLLAKIFMGEMRQIQLATQTQEPVWQSAGAEQAFAG